MLEKCTCLLHTSEEFLNSLNEPFETFRSLPCEDKDISDCSLKSYVM
jgi:hypothetical protein